MRDIFIGMEKCLVNDKCEFAYISDRLLRLLGYTRQDLAECLDDSFFNLIHPEDRQRVREELARQTGESGCYTLKYRALTKDGRTLYLYEQGSVVRENGVDYYCGEIADATKYDAIDTYYKNILNSMSNPIIITNLDKRIVFMNRSAEQGVGLTTGECAGKACEIFKTPFCGTEDCCLKRHLRGEDAAVQKTPGGRYNRVNFSPFRDASGQTIGYISVSTDITELVEVEEELKNSEERLRTALKQTRNVVWEFDIASGTIYRPDKGLYPTADDEDRSVFRYSSILEGVPESLLTSGLVHRDFAGELDSLYSAVLRGDAAVEGQLKLRDGSGNYRWTQINCSPVFDAKGKPVRAIGVSRDINDEKELERQLATEKQYRDSITKDAMCVYEANLTRDRLLRSTSEWSRILDLRPDSSYSELVKAAKEKAVHPDDRDHMQNSVGREALLREFEQGKRIVSCEYRRLEAGGRRIWVCLTIYLIRSEETGEISAFFYLKDIDEKKKRELTLKSEAELDPLTGTYNRAAAKKLVDQYLKKADAGLSAMFMLDIDNFKQVNDSFGHLFGDEVLSKVARELEKIFRKNDTISRLGGDEFLVFIRDIPDRQTAEKKACQICRTIRPYAFPDGVDRRIAVSVGLSFFPADGGDFDALYHHADIALYEAKKRGKDRYCVYNSAMTFEE